MPYGDTSGLKTVFPSVPFPGGEKSAARGKKPCAYGPRDADGYCPKKPASAKKKSARARRPLKVGRSLPGYVKITRKNPLRAPTTTETIGGALIGRKALPALKKGAQAFLQTGAGKLTGAQLLKAGLGKTGGILGSAGLLAYFLASYGLKLIDRKKLDLQEQAFRAAQAYRAYREKLAGDQGKPLTKTQLKQTADIYRSELLKLGLSTNDLKKIMGATIYDRGHEISSQ